MIRHIDGAGKAKDYLQNLQKRSFPRGIAYGYRLIVPKSVWIAALQGIAQEQNWDNFKSEVGKRMGRDGAECSEALHDVWQIIYRLSEFETRQRWS